MTKFTPPAATSGALSRLNDATALRRRHVLKQVELEEMMGVRALHENPELR
jgi:hypothetical protein